MTWFRRQHEAMQQNAEPDATDSPAVLLQNLYGVIAFINQNAGRLPGECVVAARRVTDAVRDVIDTADDGQLDVYAVISVKGIVNDYLPTTLRAYLALNADEADVLGSNGRTPEQSLLDQLNSLWAGASDIRAAARLRDADALASQGNFLHTKFTGSDLDL